MARGRRPPAMPDPEPDPVSQAVAEVPNLRDESRELACLPALQQKQRLLEMAWVDLHVARESGRATAVTQTHRMIEKLTDSLAAAERAEAESKVDPLEDMSAEDLVSEQCRAIEDPDFLPHLLEPLVLALTRRLGVRAIQRLVTPTLRVIESETQEDG